MTGRWRLELYLTPGNLVYSTAGVLAALFLATAVLVLLLQAREKVGSDHVTIM